VDLATSTSQLLTTPLTRFALGALATAEHVLLPELLATVNLTARRHSEIVGVDFALTLPYDFAQSLRDYGCLTLPYAQVPSLSSPLRYRRRP